MNNSPGLLASGRRFLPGARSVKKVFILTYPSDNIRHEKNALLSICFYPDKNIMIISHHIEVKRSKPSIALLFWSSLGFAVVGCLQLLFARQLFGASMCFFAAIIWGIDYHWSKNTPYIRITHDEVIICATMIKPPVIFQWTELQNMYLLKKKVKFLLKNGRELQISFREIDRNELVAVLPLFKEKIFKQNLGN